MAITEVKTLDDALDVVNAWITRPGILVDPFHHERVGHEPKKIREIPERWLSYAQLCDMPECGVVTDPDAYYIDAIDGRLAPGEGSIPAAAITGALPADLPISLEIRSRYYRERYPDHVERARVILERARAFFADLHADADTD